MLKSVKAGKRKLYSPVRRVRSKKLQHLKAGEDKRRRIMLRAVAKPRSFHIPDVEPQGTERAGRRGSGSWDSQKWLIGKKLAHVVKEKLIADSRKVADSPNKEQSKYPKAKRVRYKGASVSSRTRIARKAK